MKKDLCKNNDLTLNWHFTNTCNMDCRYCFIPHSKAVSTDEYYYILKKVCESGIFSRINFVGGEPTVSSLLPSFLEITKNFGLNTSIVTNGYKLIKDEKFCDRILSNLDILGLSIDSINSKTNMLIGRRVLEKNHYNVIEKSDYNQLCRKVKKYGVKLKLNTVVSKLNLAEDFNSFYDEVQPDRIKLFQVLKPNVCTKHCYDDLLISKSEFNAFVKNHEKFAKRIVAEDNNDMTSSYYMLRSDGKFLDNLTGMVSPSLTEVSVKEALSYVFIDQSKYEKRYA